MKIHLLDKKDYRRCFIYFDLMTVSCIEKLDDLDMTQDQRAFSEKTSCVGEYPNCATTLYYLFGSIRVKDNIVKNVAKIISGHFTWEAYLIKNEDRIDCSPDTIDLEKYTSAKPRLIVTSMSEFLNDKTEKISVHVCQETRKILLQYSFADNAVDQMFRRISKLMKHDRKFIITNKPLREFITS